MQYEMSRERLRHYFGHVTYIDDKFDVCLVRKAPVDEEVDESGPPLLPDLPAEVVSPEASELPQIDVQDRNLQTLLETLNQEEYSEISLNPILFSKSSRDEQLINRISSSPLTIIDWNLGDDRNAFDIIQKLFSSTSQLKVIAVYTASYLDAKKCLENYPTLTECPCNTEAYERFDAYRCNNSSLLIVTDKQSYDISGILEIVTELFIENCGIMPVALLDFMEASRELSDNLFKAFSTPLSDLYNIQMHFSEKSDAEISAALTQLIQNKFLDTYSVDIRVIEELFQHQKSQLKRFADTPNAATRFKECVMEIQVSLPEGEKEYCNILSEIDFEEFRKCTDTAVQNGNTWARVLSYYSPFFRIAKKLLVEQEVQRIIGVYDYIGVPEEYAEEIQKNKDELKKKLENDLHEPFARFKDQIFPVLIQLLISDNCMLHHGAELVQNMKYKIYSNPSLHDLLSEACYYDKRKKSAFLLDKLHFGDVLIKKEDEETTDYLLCITPPCDVFRPAKTDLNVIFIRGVEIPEKKLTSERKQNCHVSAIPVTNGAGGGLRFVSWEFFNVVRFNLSMPEEYKALCEWSRPYRMTEQYVRQISNLFTAYFSRAGVDELFIKSESKLRPIFM